MKHSSLSVFLAALISMPIVALSAPAKLPAPTSPEFCQVVQQMLANPNIPPSLRNYLMGLLQANCTPAGAG